MSNSMIVVDASIALKWFIKEGDSEKAFDLLQRWKTQETLVLAPILLIYEITNTLYQNIRKGKIQGDKAAKSLKALMLSGLEFDDAQYSALGVRAIELAQQYGLKATYDAYYLALAEREGCELWTADIRLWKAVQGKIDWVRNLEDHNIATAEES